MGCCLGFMALFAPRLTLFLIFLFSDYLGRAFETNFWPFMGFLFLPLTTLTYAFAMNANGSVSGLYLVLVVIAALMDLGLIGGAHRSSRAYYDD